jgi:hypothetical protein
MDFGFWISDFGLEGSVPLFNPKSKIQNPQSALPLPRVVLTLVASNRK